MNQDINNLDNEKNSKLIDKKEPNEYNSNCISDEDFTNKKNLVSQCKNSVSFKNIITQKLFEYNNLSDIPVIDQIFEKTGYGKLQIRVFFSFAFLIFSEGYHLLFFPSTMIVARKYFNINDNLICIINSLLFVSIGIGNILSSLLSSKLTRKNVLAITLAIYIPSSMIMALYKSLMFFAICFIINGFAIGISVPLVNNTLVEVLPIKYRGFLLIFVWCFFTMSQLIIAILMSVFMPNFETKQFYYVLMIGTFLTILLNIVSYFIYIESPRSLLIGRNYVNAIKLLEYNLGYKISMQTKQKLMQDYDDFDVLKKHQGNKIKNIDVNENVSKNSLDNNNSSKLNRSSLLNHNNSAQNLKNINTSLSKSNLEVKTISIESSKKLYPNSILKSKGDILINKDYKHLASCSSDSSEFENSCISSTYSDYELKEKSSPHLFKKLFDKNYRKITIITSILWFVNAVLFLGPSLIITLTMQEINKNYKISNSNNYNLNFAKAPIYDIINYVADSNTSNNFKYDFDLNKCFLQKDCVSNDTSNVYKEKNYIKNNKIIINKNYINNNLSEHYVLNENTHFDSIIKSLFIVSISTFFCIIVSAILTELDILGRKNTLVCCYGLSAIFVSLILINSINFKIYFVIFNLFAAIGFNVCGSYSLELFSTDVRDTAIGFFFFFNRLGGVISQFVFLNLFRINFILPYYILLGYTIIAFVLCTQYPYDTGNKPLDYCHQSSEEIITK